jgi:hypothetical protein
MSLSRRKCSSGQAVEVREKKKSFFRNDPALIVMSVIHQLSFRLDLSTKGKKS